MLSLELNGNIVTSKFSKILTAFSLSTETPVQPLGKGNINETFIVDTPLKAIVLQKISGEVFPDPVAVMDNYKMIHHHLTSKDSGETEGFVMAAPIYTGDGGVVHIDDAGGCWRAQRYVDTRQVETVDSAQQGRSVGATLARFHHLFHDLHLSMLKDPLPGFHHLLVYLESYDRIPGEPVCDSDESLSFCRRTVDKYREKAGTIEQARQRGELTPQPIHGDPKLDNFIFGRGGEATGLLDLDTVGAGLIYHDLGDCLRSACSISGESVVDRTPPGFDLQRGEWIVDGYWSEGGVHAIGLRPELIYDGLLAICFELGLRFLTDYLKGNVYFRVQKDGDNLIRAKKQFQLFEEIVVQETTIRRSIEAICT